MPVQRENDLIFIDSWDEMQAYFKDLSLNESYKFSEPINEVISYLREKNYDKVFRAGKSM